jgi:hypothetical protein
MSARIKEWKPVPTNPRTIHIWICPTCGAKRATYAGDSPIGWRPVPSAKLARLECKRCATERLLPK